MPEALLSLLSTGPLRRLPPPRGAVARVFRDLLGRQDWIPGWCRAPLPGESYRRHALGLCPDGSWSLLLLAWGPGQASPVHDHPGWSLVGVVSGAVDEQRHHLCPVSGRPQPLGRPQRLTAGRLVRGEGGAADLHTICNPERDRTAWTLHLYGADLSRVPSHVYAADGSIRACTLKAHCDPVLLREDALAAGGPR